MAKKKIADDYYIAEMRVWIKQQTQRLKSCEVSIAEYRHQLVIIAKLQKLERSQAEIIEKQLADGEKTLAYYLAKQKKQKKQRR